jgi:hypothetical protein
MYEKQYHQGAAAGFTGQISAGSALGGIAYQDKPAQPTRLDTAADHLTKIYQGFADMNGRLERIANRLGGSVPEPVEKVGASMNPTCTSMRFEALVEDMGAQLRRMDTLVTRLDAL